MRILILSKKVPFPSNDGESIAISILAKHLKDEGATIDLLTMNTTKHFTDLDNHFKPDYYRQVTSVKIDNRIKRWDAFVNLLSKKSYHIERFISKEFGEKLKQLLLTTDYDIVQFESIYMMPYMDIVRKNSEASISLRAHNIEYNIWEELTKNENNILKKLYLKILTSRLKKFELNGINDCDLLVAISENDKDFFINQGLKQPVIVCPVGKEINPIDEKEVQNQLCFIGSLDWEPNVKGLSWFVDEVFPMILKNRPDTILNIAGRNARIDRLGNIQNQHIVFHGEVADSHDYMNNFTTMVVPLFSGSGMRVKIIEGLALGRAIVATVKAVEGIDAIHNQQLLISDDARIFADHCISCLNNDSLRISLMSKGREFIYNNYSPLRIAKLLYGTYLKLININNDEVIN